MSINKYDLLVCNQGLSQERLLVIWKYRNYSGWHYQCKDVNTKKDKELHGQTVEQYVNLGPIGKLISITPCAAGPWIDGPPPKDGEDYLAQIKKHKKTFVVVWRNGFGWGCNEPWCLPEDPIKYAEIKLPEVK